MAGLIACSVVFCCTCVHARRVKVLKPYVDGFKTGPLSIMYKASVIGVRQQRPIMAVGLVLAAYILLLR